MRSSKPAQPLQSVRHSYESIRPGLGAQSKSQFAPTYFNEQNNESLLISIQTAGVYIGKKDKRLEKTAETEESKLEERTDFSDAFDTLYIGCERFPQETVLLPVTSDF